MKELKITSEYPLVCEYVSGLIGICKVASLGLNCNDEFDYARLPGPYAHIVQELTETEVEISILEKTPPLFLYMLERELEAGHIRLRYPSYRYRDWETDRKSVV